MACNNWEKLAKAQKDYPKPKFAVSFVDKSLKKTPKNPFLLVRNPDTFEGASPANLWPGLESGSVTSTKPRAKDSGIPVAASMEATWLD